MRNRLMSLVIFLGALACSTSAVAQVYFPAASGGRSKEARDAAAAEPKPAYVPHDLSGIWARVRATDRGGGPIETLLGGAPAPPMTAWGQEQFKANKPSQYQAEASRKVPPAVGNDPLGKCDPLGYPRNLGTFEFLQTPTKMVQIFQEGLRLREIWTDGRKILDDVDPRWYGWAVGHWEGNTLVVDSRGFDGRTWLDGDGHPHSEDMTLQERITHPDAETLVINMTLTDPRAYTKPWVGNPQTFKLLLPKDRTELYEWYCVPSEEESFNEGVRNPAGGIVSKNNNK